MRTFKTEFTRLGLSNARRRSKTLKSGKASDKQDEDLTDADFKELMGVYRPTYKRAKGGAFRQR